jgi:hypothetical protein
VCEPEALTAFSGDDFLAPLYRIHTDHSLPQSEPIETEEAVDLEDVVIERAAEELVLNDGTTALDLSKVFAPTETDKIITEGMPKITATKSIIKKIMERLSVTDTDSVHSSVDSLDIQEAAIEGHAGEMKRVILADLVVEICRRKYPTIGFFAVNPVAGSGKTRVSACGPSNRRLRWVELCDEVETRWDAHAQTDEGALMDKKKLSELIQAEINRLAWELKDERTRVGMLDAFEQNLRDELADDVVREVLEEEIRGGGRDE